MTTRTQSTSGLLALAIAAGCGQPGDLGRVPLHMVLVCAEPLAGERLACDPSARSARYGAWAEAAIERPGSTFAVWVAGPDRESAVPLFVARVPERWGAGVSGAKTRFTEIGKQRAASPTPLSAADAALPEDAATAQPSSGEITIEVLGASPAGAAAWQRASDSAQAPAHAAVICDRSDSTLGVSCGVTALRTAFASWIDEGGVAAGASFEVYVPGRTRDGVRRVVTVTTPALSAGERIAFLIGAGRELDAWAVAAKADGGSAIAEAISVAGERLAERDGPRTLYVLSDLRQVTPRRWNFERRAPTPAAFQAWLQREQLNVDLTGVIVRVCGPHHERAPGAKQFDARTARAVVEVWRAAFQRMGATDTRIVSECSHLEMTGR